MNVSCVRCNNGQTSREIFSRETRLEDYQEMQEGALSILTNFLRIKCQKIDCSKLANCNLK